MRGPIKLSVMQFRTCLIKFCTLGRILGSKNVTTVSVIKNNADDSYQFAISLLQFSKLSKVVILSLIFVCICLVIIYVLFPAFLTWMQHLKNDTDKRRAMDMTGKNLGKVI